MAILFCFFLVSLVTLVSSIFFKQIKNTKFNLPPSPPSLPIIGNLHHLTGLPHRCYHKLSIKYGPVILLHLGFVPVVVISLSEAAEAVLKTHDLECCSRPKTVGTGKLSYGFKDISFVPYSEYWREMRKLAVTELFSLKKVQSYRYIRGEEIEFMVKKLSESALKQSPEGIEELVTAATTAIGSFTFSDFFPSGLGRFLDCLFRTQTNINKVSEKLDAFYQHVIDDHLKPSTLDSSGDIVALMLDMIKKKGHKDDFKLNVDNIKAVLMNIFLAGIDTGAITMIWAMTELVKKPLVMKRAQENIRGVLGLKRDRITEEDLCKFDCLKHIVKETLRLHPPVPFLVPRETISHIKIQGYDIPPKTQIQVNVLHFRGQHFDFLPFGSGRRICPAISMAIATVELGLMNLLDFFDWRLPDGMKVEDIDIEEAGNVTVVKKLLIYLVPLQRH
ncbi:putative cytochrome P450 [Arabidopsis thaliana]